MENKGQIELEPLVSIGLPVYNGENYLREAIESVLAQTYHHWELIISDNASTDRTATIAQEYAVGEPRIRYFRQKENLGAAANFNFTFLVARGQYFKWLAADEGIEPDFTAACLHVFQRHRDVVLACTRYIGMNEFTHSITKLDYNHHWNEPRTRNRFRRFLAGQPVEVLPIWGLIKKDVLANTPRIQGFIGADYCLVLELLLRGPFAQVPQNLKRIRTHADAFHTKCNSNKKLDGMQGLVEARWFNPNSKGKVFFPYWRRAWEYIKLIATARETLAGKLIMIGALLATVGRRWSHLLIKELLFGVGCGQVYVLARRTIKGR